MNTERPSRPTRTRTAALAAVLAVGLPAVLASETSGAPQAGPRAQAVAPIGQRLREAARDFCGVRAALAPHRPEAIADAEASRPAATPRPESDRRGWSIRHLPRLIDLPPPGA